MGHDWFIFVHCCNIISNILETQELVDLVRGIQVYQKLIVSLVCPRAASFFLIWVSDIKRKSSALMSSFHKGHKPEKLIFLGENGELQRIHRTFHEHIDTLSSFCPSEISIKWSTLPTLLTNFILFHHGLVSFNLYLLHYYNSTLNCIGFNCIALHRCIVI